MKHYEHPEAGRLVFDFTVLEVLDERMASLRLITYVPAPGTGTREKMETLLGSTAPSPCCAVDAPGLPQAPRAHRVMI